MPLMFISMGEIVIIAVIALIIFGPDKLPEIARTFGEGVRAMRRASHAIKKEIFEASYRLENSNMVREMEEEIQSAKKLITQSSANPLNDSSDQSNDDDSPIVPVKR